MIFPRYFQNPPNASRRTWNPLTLAALTSLWIASLDNWPFWHALTALPELALPRGIIVLSGFFGIVAALTFGLIALFAWRWSVKPVIALFLIAAALGAHFMGTYSTAIDSTMMTNMLQTNTSEVRDLLSVRLLLSVLVLAVLPLIWIWQAKLNERGG